MTDLPPAIVESPRSPLRPRPEHANALRKLIAVGIVIGTCFGCWKLLHPWWRSESNKQLEARQNRARDNVGNALDELFAHQLEADSTSIDLVASFDVAPELGGGYDPATCGWGFDDAFSEALGPDVVRVSTFGMVPQPATRLAIAATIRPSGKAYLLPRSHLSYTGIVVTADMTFLGKQLHVELAPGPDIEFKHVQLGIPFRGTSDSEIAGAVIQGMCKQLGYAVLEAWTKWKRPPIRRLDPMAECDEGYHCRDNAEAIERTDGATAARFYAKACELGDDNACMSVADLEVVLTTTAEHRARVLAVLDAACARSLAGACYAAARIVLMPIDRGTEVSSQQRHDARAYYLRSCDLGDGDACASVRALDDPTLAEAPLAGSP
jgi:hypothetical protein